MVERRGRRARPGDLRGLTRHGRLDPRDADPGWEPATGQDPVAVALAAIQHRLFHVLAVRAVDESGAPFDAALDAMLSASAGVLGVGRRSLDPLAEGSRPLQLEQLLGLMLAFGVGLEELRQAPGTPGAVGLLPAAHREWLAWPRRPGRPVFREPEAEPRWPEVARAVLAQLRDRRRRGLAHLAGAEAVAIDACVALEEYGGPRTAVADRVGTREGVRFVYQIASPLALDVVAPPKPLSREGVARLAAVLVTATPGRHVTLLVLDRLSHQRLRAGLAPLQRLTRVGDTVEAEARHLVALDVSVPAGLPMPAATLRLLAAQPATAEADASVVLALETVKTSFPTSARVRR